MNILNVDEIHGGYKITHNLFGVLYLETRDERILVLDAYDRAVYVYRTQWYINGAYINMQLKRDLHYDKNQNFLQDTSYNPLEYHKSIIWDIQNYLYPEDFV